MMKSISFCDNRLQITDHLPIPEAVLGEALIRVRMAGICRTDLEITQGYMGFEGILGHEFVGEIVEPVNGWSVGTRVVGEINAGCGQCDDCRQGLERHCRQRSVLGIFRRHGCMAEWMTLPIANLLPVPEGIPDRIAVLTEPLAAVLEIFEQILIQPYQKVCILGDGKLGLLTALVFSYRHEGESLLIGHHSDKLAVVQDRISVLLEDDIPESMQKTWDIVIEATGTSSGMRRAMNLVRPRGCIVLKSTMAHPDALDLTPLVIDEINLIGSRCGRFAPALSLLSRKIVPFERLIEAVYPMDEALTAWETAKKSGAKKVLLQIGKSNDFE